MRKDENAKQTETYYIKKVNRDFLLIVADEETRKLPVGQRVTDDQILDAYLDQLRETAQSPTQPIKKNAARAEAVAA